jgi:glycosyltransferase involved in cell wall biosynthesis
MAELQRDSARGEDVTLDVSVLLATRRRADLLRSTLAHLARQVTDGLRWEVIVVDNGGDDATAAVLAAAHDALPLIVLAEPRTGKNRALNRALPVARGALFVFTDDDVEPVPRWLAEHAGAAGRWPSHAIFSGPIVPRLPPSAPPWLATHAFAVAAFARFEPAAIEGPCPSLPFGANFAVRARRMEGVRFREDMGSQGGTSDLMGGETELLQRFAAAGECPVFVPSAGIAHVIEPHQTTPEWLLRRAFRHGRTYRRLQGAAHPRTLASSRLWARLAARWVVHAFAAGERARLEADIKLFQARGQLYEHALARPAMRRMAERLLP